MLKPGDKVKVIAGTFRGLVTIVAEMQDDVERYSTIEVPLNRGWGMTRDRRHNLWNVDNNDLKFLGVSIRRGGE